MATAVCPLPNFWPNSRCVLAPDAAIATFTIFIKSDTP
nr:MAG TPA: hypothetical protein [Caudoviricetes sp.]